MLQAEVDIRDVIFMFHYAVYAGKCTTVSHPVLFPYEESAEAAFAGLFSDNENLSP